MIRGLKARLLGFGYTQATSSQRAGYTIIEIMIVLAVTSVLLVAAMTVISGQQQRTEFSQAIRDVESEVRDVINDVAHGFYPNTNNFSCSSTGSGPDLSSIASTQGSNKDCIFIGRVIQFGVGGSSGKDFNIYSLVGQRQTNIGAAPRDVSNLTEAQPKAIAPSSSSGSNFPDATDKKTLGYGLSVQSMKYIDGSTSSDIGAVAFISGMAETQDNNLDCGTPAINLVPVNGTNLNENPLDSVETINGLNCNSPINPDGGVEICFQSGGTDQHGLLTIGSNGRKLSTNLDINNGTCS